MVLGNRLWLAHYHPSRTGHLCLLKSYNKLTIKGWAFFTFGRDAKRKTNVLAAWEASLKQGGSCGSCQRAVASSLSSASQRSSPSARKGTVLKLTTVGFVNELRLYQTNGLFVNSVCVFVFVCGQSAGNVTEARSHDECSGGRRVTGVHGSVTGKGTKV